MAAYKAVLADEQVLFTEGIKLILSTLDNPEVEVIAAAKTGKDLLEIIENVEADLVLCELSFSDMDHEELIDKIKALRHGIKLFILSAYGDIKLVRSCFNQGIDGYALKSNSIDTLKNGILDVMQDKIFLGEGLQVAPQINEDKAIEVGVNPHIKDRFLLKQQLTKRELQILKLIVSGLNNRQISKELYISHETVGVHKKNIKKKFDVNSTPLLIQFAIENKIVSEITD